MAPFRPATRNQRHHTAPQPQAGGYFRLRQIRISVCWRYSDRSRPDNRQASDQRQRRSACRGIQSSLSVASNVVRLKTYATPPARQPIKVGRRHNLAARHMYRANSLQVIIEVGRKVSPPSHDLLY